MAVLGQDFLESPVRKPWLSRRYMNIFIIWDHGEAELVKFNLVKKHDLNNIYFRLFSGKSPDFRCTS